MKTVTAVLGAVLVAASVLAGAQSAPATAGSEVHRYVVERTFSAGALDGLDSALKAKVNATNAKFGVHWLMSYANVDSVTEVPVTLLPK